MVLKISLFVLLVPLSMGWPTESSEKEMMMKFMMHKGGEDKDMMEGQDDKKDMMMHYMMAMWKKEHMKGHYPGDADGCKKEEEEEDEWKQWAEKEKEEKTKKMMEDFKKFKEFMAHKKMMEEKHAMEEKKKMYEMWQKHKEMKEREEKENEFKDLIESFQNQKHKFAFKLTHEFLQLCQCAEVSEQMEKMDMFEMKNGSHLMDNMDNENVTNAMQNGDMAMMAKKLSKMSLEEKKKVFMSGLIKSMCTGAQMFIQHVKQFEEKYMMNMHQGNTTSSGAPDTTTDPFVSK